MEYFEKEELDNVIKKLDRIFYISFDGWKHRDTEETKIKLEKHFNKHPEHINYLGSFAIRTMAGRGQYDFCKVLIEKYNADINVVYKRGDGEIETLISNIFINDNVIDNYLISFLKYLIDRNIDIFLNDNDAIKYFKKYGLQEIIDYIVEKRGLEEILTMSKEII